MAETLAMLEFNLAGLLLQEVIEALEETMSSDTTENKPSSTSKTSHTSTSKGSSKSNSHGKGNHNHRQNQRFKDPSTGARLDRIERALREQGKVLTSFKKSSDSNLVIQARQADLLVDIAETMNTWDVKRIITEEGDSIEIETELEEYMSDKDTTQLQNQQAAAEDQQDGFSSNTKIVGAGIAGFFAGGLTAYLGMKRKQKQLEADAE